MIFFAVSSNERFGEQMLEPEKFVTRWKICELKNLITLD